MWISVHQGLHPRHQVYKSYCQAKLCKLWLSFALYIMVKLSCLYVIFHHQKMIWKRSLSRLTFSQGAHVLLMCRRRNWEKGSKLFNPKTPSTGVYWPGTVFMENLLLWWVKTSVTECAFYYFSMRVWQDSLFQILNLFKPWKFCVLYENSFRVRPTRLYVATRLHILFLHCPEIKHTISRICLEHKTLQTTHHIVLFDWH
jgi:hypothetical protein